MTFKRIFGFVAMLILGEAIYFGTDIWKSWMEVNWGQRIKTQQREAAADQAAQGYADDRIHLSRPVFAKASVRCYPTQAGRIHVSNWDGNASTEDRFIEMLKQFDPKLFTPQSIVIVNVPIAITPFVHWAKQEQRRGFADPNAKPIVSGLATMKLDDLGGVECVIAAMGDQIIFVPLADYRAAGLPNY